MATVIDPLRQASLTHNLEDDGTFTSFFLALLIGCTQITPELTWVTPGEGDSVAGTVELRVAATGETPPDNVVFTVSDAPVAKVYAEEGVYSTFWDSKTASPGAVTLTAKPYGGTAIRRVVTVANTKSE